MAWTLNFLELLYSTSSPWTINLRIYFFYFFYFFMLSCFTNHYYSLGDVNFVIDGPVFHEIMLNQAVYLDQLSESQCSLARALENASSLPSVST